jgi:hypothetical protein
MTTTTSIQALIKAAITSAGVNAVDGPATDLPADYDGLVAQAAVLWPDARLNRSARMSGGSSSGEDGTVVICVGATANDALAVADKVHGALDGLVLSAKGSPLRQTARTRVAPEPNADPVRVSCAVEYSTITKG